MLIATKQQEARVWRRTACSRALHVVALACSEPPVSVGTSMKRGVTYVIVVPCSTTYPPPSAWVQLLRGEEKIWTPDQIKMEAGSDVPDLRKAMKKEFEANLKDVSQCSAAQHVDCRYATTANLRQTGGIELESWLREAREGSGMLHTTESLSCIAVEASVARGVARDGHIELEMCK